jgi:hypothetical protein
MHRIAIELVAIRAVLETPESDRPDAAEQSDALMRDVLRAFRPMGLVKAKSTSLATVHPLRKAGSR